MESVMTADLLADCGELLTRYQVAPTIIQRVITELRYRYGGDRVFIPKIDRASRNQRIADGFHQGDSLSEIARNAGCSTSTVRRISQEWTL
jgi:DNA invertase Pin-like site-specific DNA recombinase